MRLPKVPAVPRAPWGWVALLLNLLPAAVGMGTVVAAARADDRRHLGVGLLQFALFWTFAVLGAYTVPYLAIVAALAWLWAILWGLLILLAGGRAPSSPAPARPEAKPEAAPVAFAAKPSSRPAPSKTPAAKRKGNG